MRSASAPTCRERASPTAPGRARSGTPRQECARGKRRGRHGSRAPPRERPVDPDSPFAALQALKKELEKSRRE